jgi:UDP-N-acetylmuramoylalanine--D-glutamate ligase
MNTLHDPLHDLLHDPMHEDMQDRLHDRMRGQSVLVLGLGRSGLAMARWCYAQGAQVAVWDSREQPPQAAVLAAELPSVQRVHTLALDGYTRIVKSPGLSPTDARLHGLLQAAQAAGVPVQGELDLFVQALALLHDEQAYTPQLLAITGTNGKTTVTHMVQLLVARTGRQVVVAGNVGPTLLDTLSAHLQRQADQQAQGPAQPLPAVWVLELSSFQLQGVEGFEPSAAVVLNISQDHLDWHGSMAAYTAAKAQVWGQHAVMVINQDDAAVVALVPVPDVVKGKRFEKGVARIKPVERPTIGFSLQPPRRPGDFGLVVENGMAWLVRALPADDTPMRKKDEDHDIHLQRLMPADALRVRGRHNAANALAALALATAIGCPLAPMLHGLREYTGEPHRLQFVATVEGVSAFDDSKATNVGAAVAALQGLGVDQAPHKLVVILGGDGKGQSFEPLAAPLAAHARAVAVMGRDAQLIADALVGTPVQVQHVDSMSAAVQWCFTQAHAGDAVLLSPACASLDMFDNYAHRGAVFVAAVQALAADRGQA